MALSAALRNIAKQAHFTLLRPFTIIGMPKRSLESSQEEPPAKKPGGVSKGKGKTMVQSTLNMWKKPSTGPSAEAPKKEVSNGPVASDTNNNSSSFLARFLQDLKWKRLLAAEFNAPYFKDMEKQLQKEYSSQLIFPPKELIFNALNKTPFDQVKIVILGQDPYHDNGQAHGLSFSVPHGIPPPPSLKNIYKELSNDIPGFKPPNHGCLEQWAERGVLLLNSALTVRAHQANSHAKLGWHMFTDHVISTFSRQSPGAVFVLWGGFAHKKEKLIDKKKHTIIKTAHPSPLSVTKFMGCKCFSQANDALKKLGREPMDWSLQ